MLMTQSSVRIPFEDITCWEVSFLPPAMATATPLRKKRNFRGLQLQVNDPPAAPSNSPKISLNLANIQPLNIRKSSQTPTVTKPRSTLPAEAASQPEVTSPDDIVTPVSTLPLKGVVPGGSKPPGGRKRPPPMTLQAPKLPPSNINVESTPSITTSDESNPVTVMSTANSATNTASFSRRNTYHVHLSNALANLDMNREIKFELKSEDLMDLQELGAGNGGSVKKVEHMPTGTIMAKKVCLYVNVAALVVECT